MRDTTRVCRVSRQGLGQGLGQSLGKGLGKGLGQGKFRPGKACLCTRYAAGKSCPCTTSTFFVSPFSYLCTSVHPFFPHVCAPFSKHIALAPTKNGCRELQTMHESAWSGPCKEGAAAPCASLHGKERNLETRRARGVPRSCRPGVTCVVVVFCWA